MDGVDAVDRPTHGEGGHLRRSLQYLSRSFQYFSRLLVLHTPLTSNALDLERSSKAYEVTGVRAPCPRPVEEPFAPPAV